MAIEKVSLKISADVAGASDVDKLVSELETLQGVSDELDNKISDLSKSIKSLDQIGTTIEAYRKLRTELKGTAQSLQEAKAAVSGLVPAYKQAETAVKASAAAQDALKTKISGLQSALASAKTSFSQINATLKEGGQITSEQAAEYFAFQDNVKRLSASLKEAKNELAGQNAEQKKLVAVLNQQEAAFTKARNAVRGLKEEEVQQRAALQGLRQELTAAGVSTTQLSSAQARVRSELKQTNVQYKEAVSASAQLKTSLSQVRTETSKPFKDPTAATREGLKSTRFASDALHQSLGLVGGALGAGAFIETTRSLDTIKEGLKVVFGTAERATEEFEFLRKAADDLGLDLLQVSKDYLRLSAASEGTSVAGEQTRRVFINTAKAMSILGASSEETSGALNALQQIISKDTVSMEELRLQLGDRLPGALKAASTGLGLTTAELVKLVSSGKLVKDEFIPAFADGLEQVFNLGTVERIQTLNSEINRFKNSLTETIEKANAGRGLSVIFDGLSQGVDTLVEGTQAAAVYVARTVELGKAQSDFLKGLITQEQLDIRRQSLNDAYIDSQKELSAEYQKQQNQQKKAAEEKAQQQAQEEQRLQKIRTELDRSAVALKAAQSELGLEGLVGQIAESETKIIKAFDTIAERSNKTQEAFDALQKTVSQELSPKGLDLVTGALNDIIINGKDSEAVINQLRSDLAGIEPGANINKVAEGLKEVDRTGKGSAESLDLLKQALAKLNIADTDNVNNALTTITKNGQDSEQVINALKKALSEVQTPEGVLSLGRALQQSGVAGDALNQGLDLVRDRLAEAERETQRLKLGLEQTDAIFQSFGIESSASIVQGFQDASTALDRLRDSGNATARDLQRAFFASTDQIVAKFAELDTGQRQTVTNLIQSQAEAAGLGNALSQAAIQTAIATGNTAQLTAELEKAKAAALSAVKSIAGIKAAFDGSVSSVQAVSDALFGQKDTIDQSTEAVRQQNQITIDLKDSVDNVISGWENLTQAEKDATVAAADAAATTGFVNEALGNINTRLSAISQAAADAFSDKYTNGAASAGKATQDLTARIAEAQSEFIRLKAVSTSASEGVFTQIAASFGAAAREIELAALQQQAALENLANQAAAGSGAALRQLTATGSELESLRGQFDLVDQSTFDGVIGEIQRLNGELTGAADRTQALQDRLESLQATSDVERQQLDNQRALRDIQAEIDAAQRAHNTALVDELKQQLALQQQINAEELKKLKIKDEQSKADKRNNASSNNQNTDADTNTRQRKNGTVPVNGTSIPAATGGSNLQPILLTMTDKQADAFIRRGLTDDVVRDVVRTSLDKVNKFRK